MIRKEIMNNISGPAPLQPYTTEELATLYGITPKTFLRWLVPYKPEIGEKMGWFFNVRQVQVIFKHIGRPERDNSN